MKLAGIFLITFMAAFTALAQGPFVPTPNQVEQASNILINEKRFEGPSTKDRVLLTAAIGDYQSAHKLRVTGKLNAETLTKMKIPLTEEQNKVVAEDLARRKAAFRATKDQIKKIQEILKGLKLYEGEVTGDLDDSTRIGLQKYQLMKNLKITGTVNPATLEKMGISLTDDQKKWVEEQKKAEAEKNKTGL